MKLISRLRDHRFCAFCKTARRVYVKKHVDLTNVVYGTALSVASGYAIFAEPDPRILIIFCLYIVSAEIFIYLRWRTNVKCRLCGFDPVTYRRSPAEASKEVRTFFDAQMKNPEFMLSRSPLLGLQKKILLQEDKARTRHAFTKRQKTSSLAQPKSL